MGVASCSFVGVHRLEVAILIHLILVQVLDGVGIQCFGQADGNDLGLRGPALAILSSSQSRGFSHWCSLVVGLPPWGLYHLMAQLTSGSARPLQVGGACA